MRQIALIGLVLLVTVACARGYVPPPPPVSKLYPGPEASYDDRQIADEAVAKMETPEKNDLSIKSQEVVLKRTFSHIAANGKEICAEVNGIHDGCKWMLVYVKDTPTLNAYAWGNRTINVNKNILAYVDNEHEMAFLLAHEMGHLLARHVDENGDSNETGAKVLKGAVSLLFCGVCAGLNNDVGHSPRNAAISEMGQNNFSGSQEREADYIAAYLMDHAGYDVEKGAKFLVKMAVLKPKSGVDDKNSAQYFDTHEFDIERIARISAAITEIDKRRKIGERLVPLAEN